MLVQDHIRYDAAIDHVHETVGGVVDARNLGLAVHGEELIPAPRNVARVGWQKGLDFSCHLSANCRNVPLLNRNANIDRGVNVTVQYLL